VVKGDSLSCSIAAASILAKEARDRIMVEMDGGLSRLRLRRPQGLSRRHPRRGPAPPGPSPIHRMSWAPVKLALWRAALGDADVRRRPRGLIWFSQEE
jgi:ribonuclease HII